MHIDQVRTFLAIVETGHFNRAAERLNVTQSTVSARIKALEQRIERPLFDRGPGGLGLTAAGRQFQRYAQSLVRLWERARADVALPPGYRTAFGLGTQASLWERLVLRWVPRFQTLAADVAVHIEADYSQSLMRQVGDGLLDLVVLYEPVEMPGLVVETLLVERLVLVTTARRKVRAGWVDDYVYVDWGREFREGHGRAFPAMETATLSVGLGALGLQYILDQGGSGYFPMRVVRPLLAEKRLSRVRAAPEFRRPAYMVYPADPVDPDLMALARAELNAVAEQERED